MMEKDSGRPPSAGKISAPVMTALVILAAAVVLTGLYTWIKHPFASHPAEPLEQVVIATNTAYVGTCPVLAARDKGYFADEGILAAVQSHTSGKAAMEAVLQGKADLGTVADIPIMLAGLNKQPVLVIATIFKAEKDHGIVGRKDRGVVLPADLKGKHIGVTLSTSGHFTLDAFLNRQKLSSSEVTMHNYPPEALPTALVRGEVDAVASWEPFLGTTLAQLGSNGVVFYGQDVYESTYSIAGMHDYVAKHPETIKKILRALAKGTKFCSDAPDAAREIVPSASKMDPAQLAELKAAWPTYRFGVVLDQGLILALEDEARWAIKNKLSGRADMPNYLDLIYLDGLESVMPSAVTIIH